MSPSILAKQLRRRAALILLLAAPAFAAAHDSVHADRAPKAEAKASAKAGASDDAGVDLRLRSSSNRLAYIPAQCFTRVRDAPQGGTQNPCYVCHAEARAPNFNSQPELQLSYAFPQIRAMRGAVNDWRNLFVDRRKAIAAIGDDAVLRHVRADNYHDRHGGPATAARLAALPERWDVDGNGRWDGYVPDAGFHFDAHGYDVGPDGRRSGWRAYAYYPFPGAFMPTNGAFDDVLIRLPAAFREREDGTADEQVYAANLAIVEALIRRDDVAIDPIDEKPLGVDLDRNGSLGGAQRIAYAWAPTQGLDMSYVGRARIEQRAGRVHLAAGLFPEGTEFLHSVRYLDIAADGSVQPAARMKELRYARKRYWMSWSDLRQRAQHEAKEGALNPDRAELFEGDAERGIDNGQGWRYQGFIEDAKGRLRPQTYAETVFCIGCHRGLSATEDGTFSFVRKVASGDNHGWHHAGARAYRGLPDPLRADGKPEYASYLRANRAGDEFRANGEAQARFFDPTGEPRDAAFAALEKDIATLLLPSRERALRLDKAYWTLVREQSFERGRDALPAPAVNVQREVDPDSATGIAEALPAPRLIAAPHSGRTTGRTN
jgi:hypothetical protein